MCILWLVVLCFYAIPLWVYVWGLSVCDSFFFLFFCFLFCPILDFSVSNTLAVFLFLFLKLILKYVCMYLCVCRCVYLCFYIQVYYVHRLDNGVKLSQAQATAINETKWLLGTKSHSSVSVASILNEWIICPDFSLFFSFTFSSEFPQF